MATTSPRERLARKPKGEERSLRLPTESRDTSPSSNWEVSSASKLTSPIVSSAADSSHLPVTPDLPSAIEHETPLQPETATLSTVPLHRSNNFTKTSDTPNIYLFGERSSVFGKLKYVLYGVAMTTRGDILVNDYNSKDCLRTFNLRGEQRRVFKISGFKTGFRPKFSVVAHDGDIFTTDCGNKQVVVCDAGGTIIRCFGEGKFVNPIGIALNPFNGKVYVVDNGSHCVRIYNTDGSIIDSFGSDQLNFPWCVCVDGETGKVAVTDRGKNRVVVFTESGEFLYSFGLTNNKDGGRFDPTGVTIDRDGILYVCSYHGNSILMFDILGNFLGRVKKGRNTVMRPVGVCVTGSELSRKLMVTSWHAAYFI